MSSSEYDDSNATDSALEADQLALLQCRWELIAAVARQRSLSVSALLHGAWPIALEGAVVIVEVHFRFHLARLSEPDARDAIAWAIEQVLERGTLFVELVPAVAIAGAVEQSPAPGLELDDDATLAALEAPPTCEQLRRLEFARWLVDHGWLSESLVARRVRQRQQQRPAVSASTSQRPP